MENIFRDTALQETFDRDGFAVIPVFNEAEIRELKKLYHSLFASSVNGLYTSHSHNTGEHSINVHNSIAGVIESAVSKVFTDFDFVVNHFVVKTHVNSTEMRLHQDWTIVDEDNTRAVHQWCPLTDISKLNGGMFVVKGSHLFFDNIRSGSMGIKFLDRTDFIDEHLTVPKVRVGEVLAYKQALFHGSFPNHSSEDRIVMLSSIKEKQGKWLYYEKHAGYDENKLVEIYEMNTESFLHQIPSLEKGIKPVNVPCINTFKSVRMETNSINEELFSECLLKKTVPA